MRFQNRSALSRMETIVRSARRRVCIAWAIVEQTPKGDLLGDLLVGEAWMKQAQLGHLLDHVEQLRTENQ